MFLHQAQSILKNSGNKLAIKNVMKGVEMACQEVPREIFQNGYWWCF